MKQPTPRIPALTLALLLAVVGSQVLAGGRDVPDRTQPGSETDSSQTAGGGAGLASCADQTVIGTTVGGLEIEVRVSSDGELSLRPALLGTIGRWFHRLLEGGDGSCPSS